MRIISGKYRGRQFKAKAPTGVRPTADAVREAIFNVLNNLIDFQNANVMDICAGTGALGIESISRGADYCRFIEKSPRTARYISNAAADFNIPSDCFDIIVQDAVKYLRNISETFHIIFFDPPYFENLYQDSIEIIAENNILDKNGILVIEYDEKVEFNIPKNLSEISSKKYGSTIVSYIEQSE